MHGKGAGVVPGTTRTLTFGGQASIQIPPGADAFSDPVALTVRAAQELAVSMFLPLFDLTSMTQQGGGGG